MSFTFPQWNPSTEKPWFYWFARCTSKFDDGLTPKSWRKFSYILSLSSYRKTTSKSAQTTKNTTYPPCAIRCRVFLVLLISLKTACFFSWILFHQILLLFTLQIASILNPLYTLILSVLHCSAHQHIPLLPSPAATQGVMSPKSWVAI